MTKEELIERIKGEVKAVGDGKIESVRQNSQNTTEQAEHEISELVAKYQKIAEALPIDMLQVIENGGRIGFGCVEASIRREHEEITVEAREQCMRFMGLADLKVGRAYDLILIAIPRENKEKIGGKKQ